MDGAFFPQVSLYVRVQCSFFSHRKTIRLRSSIGEAALWVPIRLWVYAAESQPNGDFSNYSPQELALIIGYQGDAELMLEALQEAGFMDGLMIHQWEEHNGYHAVFASRAKRAADARWAAIKEKEAKRKKTVQERKGKETSIATSMLQASASNASSISAFIDELRPLYPDIDLDREFRKMNAFFLTPRGKQRKLTKRFAVSWLNRCDVPMPASNGHGKRDQGYHPDDWASREAYDDWMASDQNITTT